jgi:hypothetical protein
LGFAGDCGGLLTVGEVVGVAGNVDQPIDRRVAAAGFASARNAAFLRATAASRNVVEAAAERGVAPEGTQRLEQRIPTRQ